MSLTRRQLLVRSGAAAVWVGAGGLATAYKLGAFDVPAAVRPGASSRPRDARPLRS